MSDKKMCVFCDIIAGKSPETVIEFSNEHIVIFNDIRPASDYHYLAVPKIHMQNVRACTLDDKDLSKCFFFLSRENVIHLIMWFFVFLMFQSLKCKMSYVIF